MCFMSHLNKHFSKNFLILTDHIRVIINIEVIRYTM